MTELIDFIKSKVNIDESILMAILPYFKEREVKREKFVLKEGHFATHYFFIKSGALRIGFNSQGNSNTAWVALENEFFTDLSSIKKKSPSKYNIQAMEDSVLLAIKSEDMDRLYIEFPIWQEFGRQIWEDAFLKVIDSILDFQNLNAEQRYLSTMQQTELLQRIPLKDLASFLGITQSSLSRLRKKIS